MGKVQLESSCVLAVFVLCCVYALAFLLEVLAFCAFVSACVFVIFC